MSARIGIVSPPLGAPWTNGSKVLARDIATGLAAQGRFVSVLATKGAQLDHNVHAITTGNARFAWLTHAATMPAEIVHGIFAPTLMNKAALRAITRGRASVQTIASLPNAETSLGDVVYADRIVVLSRAAEQRALAEGISPERVVRIRPTVHAPRQPSTERIHAEAKRIAMPNASLRIAFVGDIEHGGGARLMVDACGALRSAVALRSDVVLVMATRAKTPAAEAQRSAIQARANARGVRLCWAGTSPDIHALLAACDVVALPTNTLFAKVDHPLILLEAMHLGVPVIVTRGTSAYELAEEGGALGVEHDASSIGVQLEALIDPSARQLQASRAQAFAQSELSTDAMARAYGAVYDALLR